jgi:hypothetical protein
MVGATKVTVPKNAVPIRGKGNVIVGYKIGNATYDPWGQATNAAAKAASHGGQTLFGAKYISGGGGGLFGGIIDAVNTNISKPLTQALQPVEKVANVVASDPKALTAIALAVAIPGVGAAIGESLMSAGIVTSAEAATAAATAAGATAAQAAAAGAAATATATVIGTAVASTAAQVAQGVPVDKAITNTLVNVGVSQVSPVVAQEINSVIGHPAVSDAITSAAASGVKTAASGGSSQDITTAMTAGLAGSAANSAYSSAANDYNSTTGKVLGSATAGAVTGGATGALTNALTTAASSLGSDTPKPTPKPSDTAALPPDQVAALGGAKLPDTTSQSDVTTGPTTIDIPSAKVAPLDITQNESAAETARLADKNAKVAAATSPVITPPVTEPKPGAYLPSTTPTTEDQKILNLIATPSNVATTVAATEPNKGAYLPETTPAPAPVLPPVLAPTTDQKILDLIAEKPTVTKKAAVGEVPATPDKTPVTAPPVETPVTTVEPPVEVDPNIPRVEVSGVGNIEPTQGAYLPDTVPAESTAIEPAPVAEGYSTSMPDESTAETARLAAAEQQILDLIASRPTAADRQTSSKGSGAFDGSKSSESSGAVGQGESNIGDISAPIPRVDVSGVGTIPVEPAPVEGLDITSKPNKDQTILDLISSDSGEKPVAEEKVIKDEADKIPTANYKPTIITATYLSPKTSAASAPTSALGSALGTTGLTAYRGAGEIESQKTGKPRKKVWNEESLKLKDALGV